MKYFFKRYESWLFNNRDIELLSYKTSIIKLFEKAGIEDCYLPHVAPMGYGKLASYNASVMNSFPNALEDFAMATCKLFQDAIGVYRTRIFETFSPIYWIDLVIFLPKTLFTYLGLNGESVIIKLFQCIWWIVTPLLLIFRDKFIEYLMQFI